MIGWVILYVATGIMFMLLVDAKEFKDTMAHFVALLIVTAIWPAAVVERARQTRKRDAYNRAAAVRRQQGRERAAIRNDMDAWWVGADLSEDYRVRVGRGQFGR